MDLLGTHIETKLYTDDSGDTNGLNTSSTSQGGYTGLDSTLREIDNIIGPANEKNDILTRSSLSLSAWLADNPGGTIEDYLNDPAVPQEDKEATIRAMLIHANPDATVAEIDQMVEDVKDNSGGTLNAGSLDHAKQITAETEAWIESTIETLPTAKNTL